MTLTTEHTRQCARDGCSALFQQRRARHVFCSRRCFERAHYRRPENRRKQLARVAAYRAHPEAQPCGCGQPGERHHPDYDRPREIVFVCRECHRRHAHAGDWSNAPLVIAA